MSLGESLLFKRTPHVYLSVHKKPEVFAKTATSLFDDAGSPGAYWD